MRETWKRVARRTAAAAVALIAGGTTSAAADSLPVVASGHRPGPDVLYQAPAHAPQLENSGPWRAPPILISGAEAYRDGEFLYQDFLFDDHGAAGTPDQNSPNGPNAFLFSPVAGTFTYPTDPTYANNAADLVELRVKPLADATAFRVTLNTLQAPDRVAFTIALGGDPATTVAWPHGAGVSSPATLFLTVHGTSAELTDVGGAPRTPVPSATVDSPRRQIEVLVPHTAWNPGSTRVRMTIGVGLWDTKAGAYLAPSPGSATATTPGGAAPSRAAIVNVGPRLNEPYPDLSSPPTVSLGDAAAGAAVQARWWRERNQADALRLGDVSAFHADVDFAKLAARTADESQVPQTGVLNRILASHYQFGQGLDPSKVCFDLASSFSAGAKCIGRYVGQLQPYTLYVPRRTPPAAGWGMTLLLHSLSANYNQYSASRNQSELGDRGPGSLVLTPGGRGPDGFYAGIAEADTFEAWADVARRYKLDPGWTTVSGYSMGGFGTYRLLARWPDLFSAGFSTVGAPGSVDSQLASLRNTPLMAWNATADELVPLNESEAAEQHLAATGLRFIEDLFTADHLGLAANDEYQPAADFLGTLRVDRDPPHVTYVANPREDSAAAQTVADHAYWLSSVAVRDPKAAPTATVDVRSEAFGAGDPPVLGVKQGAGTLGGYHGATPYVERRQDWGPAPRAAVNDALDITAANISTVTIDPARARVSCAPQLKVKSDGPLTVVLDGCGPATRQRFGRGRAVRTLTCLSQRRLVLRPRHPQGTRVIGIKVFVSSASSRPFPARVTGRLQRVVVDLRGRVRGTVFVRMLVRVTGPRGRVRVIDDRRRYLTCASRVRHVLRGIPRRRRPRA